EMLRTDPGRFRALVDRSLRRHYELVRALSGKGTYFFDYGNSFLKAVSDAGVREVCRNGENPLDGFVFQWIPVIVSVAILSFETFADGGEKRDVAKEIATESRDDGDRAE
ncbi:MAG: urocanate hydratase, partial [Actinobacteria bacterium]|nr:urocanate hydratase [Actinomycetota bacterium]